MLEAAQTPRSEADQLPEEVDTSLLRRTLGPHLDALTRDRRHDGWIQFGMTPLETQWPSVLADLDWLATELLDEGTAANFFYMRKPPGLRVRFETTPAARDTLAARIEAAMTGWPKRLARMQRSRYEPEERLFGGAPSMAHVHRLFTADSLAWLAYSGLADRRPPWLFSLAMLRQLMDGLAVADRDDPKVWELIRRQTGRNVPEALNQRKVATVAPQIRTLWTDPDVLRTALGDEASDLADEYGVGLRRRAAEWRAGYFASDDAAIGTRDAAAFATIFHWNRGAVASLTQRLIATALAERPIGL